MFTSEHVLKLISHQLFVYHIYSHMMFMSKEDLKIKEFKITGKGQDHIITLKF